MNGKWCSGQRRSLNVGWPGLLLAATVGIGLGAQSAAAQAQGRVVRGTTQTSVNRNVQVNRSVQVQRDIDVDVDRDYHPVAAAAAVGTAAVATAAAVGTVVHSLPAACTAVRVGDMNYQQCGDTWYQPQYAGTQLTYVVVAPPR